jgi:hypothetical protein
MKRFEFAAEVSKQLITVSLAVTTVVAGFYEKFFSQGTWTFALVVVDLLIFVASIICGVFSLGAIVTLAARQERADFETTPDPSLKVRPRPRRFVRPGGSSTEPQPRRFVRLGGSSAAIAAAGQQLLFGAGVFVFVVVAIADKANWLPKAGSSSTATTSPKPTPTPSPATSVTPSPTISPSAAAPSAKPSASP